MSKDQQLQHNESLLNQVLQAHDKGKAIVQQVASDVQRPRPDDLVPFDLTKPLVTPALLGHMLDAAPVLAVQLVQSQRDPMIVHATRRIEELFGYGQDELQGRPLSVLLPEDVHVAHEAYMEKFVAAPHDRQLGDLADVPCPRGRKKDGTIFHLEIMLTVCIVAANQFGVATIMPQIRSAAELATV